MSYCYKRVDPGLTYTIPIIENVYVDINLFAHSGPNCSNTGLKPRDSCGTWRKLKLFLFFLVNAQFYRVVRTFNALLTVHSEMLPYSGNNQHIKMFGVPPNTLP